MLVYGQKPILIMDYKKYGGFILKKLLEITEKVPQLREAARRVIQKLQAELNKKFKEMKIQKFQKEDLVWYFNKPAAM